jgi:hypothetical protein
MQIWKTAKIFDFLNKFLTLGSPFLFQTNFIHTRAIHEDAKIVALFERASHHSLENNMPHPSKIISEFSFGFRITKFCMRPYDTSLQCCRLQCCRSNLMKKKKVLSASKLFNGQALYRHTDISTVPHFTGFRKFYMLNDFVPSK